MDKRKIVYMGNTFIEASYKCNPIEKKILNLAILKANRKDFPDKPNPHMNYFVTMTKMDLMEIAGLDTIKDFRNIKNACKSLNEKVIVYLDEKGKEFETSSFITNTKLKNGLLELGFSGRVIPFFNQLKEKFTSYDLLQTKHFTGKYTIRFYELIKQYETIGNRTLKIDYLRKMFQLEDKYLSSAEFKRNVIDSAQKELKEKSELYFTYKKVLENRKLVAINIRIKLDISKVDKKYLNNRIDGYLSSSTKEDFYTDLHRYYEEHQKHFSIAEKQAISEYLIKAPDPRTLSNTLMYHFFEWLEPKLGI